jgi:beta-lactamase class D
MLIVKDILLNEATPKYILRAKTGWVQSTQPNIGWWVGWVETDDNTYFFAMNIDMSKKEDPPARMAVTKEVLKQVGAIPELDSK